MEYLRIDPKFRRRPRPKKAGWVAREVLQFLWQVSADYDLRGRIPPSMQDASWLADEWNADGAELVLSVPIATFLQRGIEAGLREGLLVREGGELVIEDWEKMYRPAKTGAQRQAEHRDRLAAMAAAKRDVTPVTDVTKTVTRDATPLHSTVERASAAPPPVKPKGRKGKEAKASNPRFTPLKQELLEAFREIRGSDFAFTGREAKHLSDLLALSSDDGEILWRWAAALNNRGFPACHTLGDLLTHWNRFTGRPAVAAPVEVREPEGEAERAWAQALTHLDPVKHSYAKSWLARLTPSELRGVDSDVLVLDCPDKYFLDWVQDHYAELIAEILHPLRPEYRVADEERRASA